VTVCLTEKFGMLKYPFYMFEQYSSCFMSLLHDGGKQQETLISKNGTAIYRRLLQAITLIQQTSKWVRERERDWIENGRV
jgi:hypothetical protein